MKSNRLKVQWYCLIFVLFLFYCFIALYKKSETKELFISKIVSSAQQLKVGAKIKLKYCTGKWIYNIDFNYACMVFLAATHYAEC